MADPITHLRDYWSEQGFRDSLGASLADVDAFEVRYGVHLPADVRRYFAELNGLPENVMDRDHVCFWNLSRVMPASEECPELNVEDGSNWFVFADFLIWSHAYAIRLSSDRHAATPVAIIHKTSPIIVADSFSSFLESYLRGDWNVLLPVS